VMVPFYRLYCCILDVGLPRYVLDATPLPVFVWAAYECKKCQSTFLCFGTFQHGRYIHGLFRELDTFVFLKPQALPTKPCFQMNNRNNAPLHLLPLSPVKRIPIAIEQQHGIKLFPLSAAQSAQGAWPSCADTNLHWYRSSSRTPQLDMSTSYTYCFRDYHEVQSIQGACSVYVGVSHRLTDMTFRILPLHM